MCLFSFAIDSFSWRWLLVHEFDRAWRDDDADANAAASLGASAFLPGLIRVAMGG